MRVRKRLTISGVVQGVGFRPFVWRRATALGLAGWVANDSGGVVAEVEGQQARVDTFLAGLAAAAPPLAVVDRVRIDDVAAHDGAARAPFEIRASSARAGPSTPLPPDIATCAACRAEVADPRDRRHGYAFTNCVDCGPRYTIIDDLPYDRAATTMRAFTMCAACAAEYHDPASRRFHAQPNACPHCGPTVWFVAAAEAPAATQRPAAGMLGPAAIAAARDLLRSGGILALKGIGGFHLVCDATSPAAVERLRQRKHRMRKPLAVMVRDVEAARGIAHVSEQETRLLESRERPIVLLRKRLPAEGVRPLAAGISPGNAFVGVLLPYAPVHELVCAGLPPLVMTSGNVAEEPIVHDNAAAARMLGPLADAFLFHDREIHVACDDSVVRVVGGAALPIRRSRGHTPLPIALAGAGPSVLAVGGEMKAAVCVTRGEHAVLSQHIGDVANLETLAALDRTADHLLRLFRVEPAAIVADLHPGYLSTAWARQFAAARGIPLVQVQHHEAHVAAIRAEAGLDAARPFIGVCFDGTGYGRDGTIQGGEFLACDAAGMRRAAHLRAFPLPGGEACIRQPWRVALAVMHAAGVPWDPRVPAVAAARGADVLRRQLDRGFGCVATTSMGRLFDAVASLAGVRHDVRYEAEAAMNLEAAAASACDGSNRRYAFTIQTDGHDATDGPLEIDWRPVVRAVAADVAAGVPTATIAAAFHEAVAAMIARVCRRLRRAGAGDVIGLTGGVFQNAVLVERARTAAEAAGLRVVTHRLVPPNDGGLALGQAALARAALSATGRASP